MYLNTQASVSAYRQVYMLCVILQQDLLLCMAFMKLAECFSPRQSAEQIVYPRNRISVTVHVRLTQ